MTRKRSTKKPNIAMCAAFVLFCLVLISTHFTSGLYARYTTSDSAEDSARVAKFDVNVKGDAKDLEITAKPSSTNEYVISINNDSEVAVAYSLSLQFDDDCDSTGVNYTFTPDTGSLNANESTEAKLEFSIDWAKFTENKTSSSNSVSVDLDFTVIVDAVQID